MEAAKTVALPRLTLHFKGWRDCAWSEHLLGEIEAELHINKLPFPPERGIFLGELALTRNRVQGFGCISMQVNQEYGAGLLRAGPGCKQVFSCSIQITLASVEMVKQSACTAHGKNCSTQKINPERKQRAAKLKMRQAAVLDWHKATEEKFLAARVQILKAGNMAGFKEMMQVSFWLLWLSSDQYLVEIFTGS